MAEETGSSGSPTVVPRTGSLTLTGSIPRSTVMSYGYVALLDVLGFSALVANDRGGASLQAYLECLERIFGASSEIDYVVFSDSIVLTLDGPDPIKLLQISRACSRLMSELIEQEIPVRGAIACGEFVRSSVGKSVFVAGRAIVDAVHASPGRCLNTYHTTRLFAESKVISLPPPLGQFTG
ncbi:MAG: hypothetical protein ACJ8R9_17895 [Steroidobacteraceae bacterium]